MNQKTLQHQLHIYTQAVQTKDVVMSLKKLAQKWKCSLGELDFDILGVHTFYGNNQIIFNPNELDFMLKMVGQNKPEEITQEYKILIYKKKTLPSPLNFSLASNKTLTKVYAAIKKDTILSMDLCTRDSFRETTHKKMILNRLLIGTWSRGLEEAIEKIFIQLEKRESLQFKNDLKFLISEGKDYTPHTPAKLTMHFEKESIDFDSITQVDHSNRDFIKTVMAGDLVAEIQRFVPGSYGRNCKGAVIGELMVPADEVDIPAFDSETILAQEEAHSLKLYAKRNGIIDTSNNKLSIKNALELQKVSFKTTGDLKGEDTADLTLQVGTNSNWQDAVGQGVKVEAKEIHVIGNIGANAELKGSSIKVGGRTHETSAIFGDDVHINIHTGSSTAECNTVNLLERGKLQGKSVEIKEMFAGSVLAEDVTVHKMHNLCKITASKRVLVHNIIGTGNHIRIDNNDFFDSIQKRREDALKVEQALNRFKRELSTKEAEKINQAPHIEETLAMLKDYKKRNLTLPEVMVKRIQNYRLIDAEMAKLSKNIEEHQDTLDLINESFIATESRLLASQIIIGHIDNEETTIEFSFNTSNQILRTFAEPYSSYQVIKNALGVLEIEKSSYGSLMQEINE